MEIMHNILLHCFILMQHLYNYAQISNGIILDAQAVIWARCIVLEMSALLLDLHMSGKKPSPVLNSKPLTGQAATSLFRFKMHSKYL